MDDDIEDSPGGWIERQPVARRQDRMQRESPPSYLHDDDEEEANPFDIYKLDSSDFVIPKKARPAEQVSAPAPAVSVESAWPSKKAKTKEINMDPEFQFGARRAKAVEPPPSPKAAPAKKRGRLRRARDDDSDSDSDIVLVSPAGAASKARPKADEEEDGKEERRPEAGKLKQRKRKRVQRERGKSLGAESDDGLNLSDEDGGVPSSGSQGKGGGRQSEEDDTVLVLDDDDEKGGKGGGGSSDDEEEDEEAQVRARMERILRQCEQISERLMRELRTWGAKDSAASAQPSDRIGLIMMADEEEEEEQGPSRHISTTKRVPTEALKQVCPNATLKPYQLVGVQWLYLTYQLGVSGILADEMGLGKTVQTIVFLAYLCQLQPGQTHLIIVPASVLANWENEFARFAPHVRVVRYHGSTQDRAALRDEYQRKTRKGQHMADVFLTTYTYWERETGKEDRLFFRKMNITYLVLDEGHSVKNLQSQRFRRLRSQPSTHRLVLSGTPVQNAVRELLVLMHFLMPEVFAFGEEMDHFFSFLSGGSTDENDQTGLIKLRKTFAPFVLRRLKQDVLDQLTSKTTKEAQAGVYNAIRDQHMARILAKAREKAQLHEPPPDETSSSGAQESRVMRSVRAELAELLRSSGPGAAGMDDKEARNVFHDFRKAANHPLLLRRFYDEEKLPAIAGILQAAGHFGESCDQGMVQRELETMNDFDLDQLCHEYRKRLEKFTLDPDTLFQSCKFQKLRELLPQLLSEGHRVLLFSQWTKILDMLEELLDRQGTAYLRLDGSTPIDERQDLIECFNEEGSEYGVFLLSTRAGGLGLNLTGADTVILHDSDWNPTIDRQAEDRCHRIGQTKPVTVYRLVTVGTVDERVYEIASAKAERSELLLDEGNAANQQDQASEDDEAAPPLTLASLVKAELEKYVARGLQEEGGATDPK